MSPSPEAKDPEIARVVAEIVPARPRPVAAILADLRAAPERLRHAAQDTRLPDRDRRAMCYLADEIDELLDGLAA